MAEAPATEFAPGITELADKLVNLTVKDAQALVDCLKSVHGIEPAGGGVVMSAVGGEAGAAALAEEEKTSFDVILAGFGDKKIQVIKVVCADDTGSERGQGPRRVLPETREGRRVQGRGREDQR